MISQGGGLVKGPVIMIFLDKGKGCQKLSFVTLFPFCDMKGVYGCQKSLKYAVLSTNIKIIMITKDMH